MPAYLRYLQQLHSVNKGCTHCHQGHDCCCFCCCCYCHEQSSICTDFNGLAWILPATYWSFAATNGAAGTPGAGTGGHTNYSTKATRTKGSGWEAIQQYAKLLEARHKEHMAAYGGAERLLGAYYAPSSDEFRCVTLHTGNQRTVPQPGTSWLLHMFKGTCSSLSVLINVRLCQGIAPPSSMNILRVSGIGMQLAPNCMLDMRFCCYWHHWQVLHDKLQRHHYAG